METCKAIILKTVPYTDTLRIVHLYSQERGYLSMVSPAGIFKRKNRAVNLLQVVEAEYEENGRDGLHRARSMEPAVQLPNLYFDIFKMNIVLLWGEVLYLVLRNEGRNEGLFEYVARAVEYLNASEGDAGNFNLFFLYRLAVPLGFRINAETWREGHVFNVHDGCFYAAGSGMPSVSGPNAAKMVHRLCTCEVGDLKGIPLNREARNILLDVVLAFYQVHMNIDFNVKGIRVLREVFA